MKTEKIDFIKYIVVGLVIGLTISYGLDINWLNGVCIGLSLGLLLQKIVQENKLLLKTKFTITNRIYN